MSTPRLLNLGCGQRIHADWTNVDLVAGCPGVIAHDIRKGLPFPDDSFNAVYLSHLLEHLDIAAAERLIRECHRVLEPGGTLRIVVPDLEQIAREYLAALDRCDAQDPAAEDDHRWMVVELIDQLVRTDSGGMMAHFFADEKLANRDFVCRRMGSEMSAAVRPQRPVKRSAAGKLGREISRLAVHVRRSVALSIIWLFEGHRGCQAFQEAMFRQSGEIHRWMYDRISLSRLLKQAGYVDAQVCAAEQSKIDRFRHYQLDSVNGRILKPDSIFVEGVKPAILGRQVKVA